MWLTGIGDCPCEERKRDGEDGDISKESTTYVFDLRVLRSADRFSHTEVECLASRSSHSDIMRADCNAGAIVVLESERRATNHNS